MLEVCVSKVPSFGIVLLCARSSDWDCLPTNIQPTGVNFALGNTTTALCTQAVKQYSHTKEFSLVSHYFDTTCLLPGGWFQLKASYKFLIVNLGAVYKLFERKMSMFQSGHRKQSFIYCKPTIGNVWEIFCIFCWKTF